MPQSLEKSVFRVLDKNGEVTGTGFLVAPTLAVTCAHVVEAAGLKPDELVQVLFSGSDEKLAALVISKYYRDPDHGDIAFLYLESMPKNITPLRLGGAEHSSSGNSFQAFGYPSVGEIEGVHARGEILGTVPENGQRLLQLRSAELNQGHSGAPVWDEKRNVVVGMVVSVYKADASGKLRDTAFAVSSEALWQVCPELKLSETCPYLGLETFTAETAQLFFGREALTEKLITILRGGCRFLAVFGPSGSGKSSVVRAGLLPKLETGLFADWKQVTLRPADDPFVQMQAAGLESLDNLTERTILFVDQFEELFTLCPDELREKFVQELAAALENSRFLLVISMRDDFYSTFNAKAALLASSAHKTIIDVAVTLERKDLLAMIEQPAVTVGLMLDLGLAELILKDLTRDGEARSSTLPLLEFALTQLWNQRRDGLMTLTAYQTIGGVTGNLARWADEAYSNLPKADQPLAESLLTSLIHLGDETQGLPDTRRRHALAEFDEPTRRVIKHFADRRLLVTGGETVELVHDALVREWGRLQNWLKENRDNLRLREGVIDDARRWENAVRDESLLNHRGARLDLALAMSKNPRYRLNQVEQAYLDVCEGLSKREKTIAARRRRYTSVGISAALIVIMAILAGWGITNTNQVKNVNNALAEANILATSQAYAETNALEQRNIAIARQLAAQAQSIFAIGNSKQQTAILLAIQSMYIFPTGEASQILQNNTLADSIARITHGLHVYSVAFSPDGKFVVSGGCDRENSEQSNCTQGSARVWDASTGKEIARMTHDGLVRSITFSPDGKFVVSGGDGTARVWDASTGKEIARMTHYSPVGTVAFSLDGKLVVSSADTTIRVWEAATGKEIAHMTHGDSVLSVALSPDGKFVVSGCFDKTARVWDATTGKEIAHMTHDNSVDSVAFSPNGKFIVSGGDETARVWEAATGKEVARMTHDGIVRSVAFSPNGKYVVSGGSDTARVWEAATGKEIARMTHDEGVVVVAFSPDGKYIVSGGMSIARVWEAATGKEITRMTHDGNVWSVAFSPDGKYVVSGSWDGTARVWKANTGKEIASMTYDDMVWSVAFSPDGKYAVSSGDTTARVWDAVTGKEIARMTHDNVVNSAAFSPDGKFVVSGGDNTARVWEATTGKEIARTTHGGTVRSVAFSPDSKFVVSGSWDNTARLWEATTGKEIARMTHDDYVQSAAFSPDGKSVVSGGCDQRDSSNNCTQGSARVWEASTGNEIARMTHDNIVTSVAFSPDGKFVVSGSWDKTSCVWEAATGKEIACMTHDDYVQSVVFSPDSKFVVSGSNDNTARVWEATTGKEIARMTHDGAVFSVAFSSDGKVIVSGSTDNTVRVWEAATGKEITRMMHDDVVESVAFSPDGKYVVSGSRDNTARVWIWHPEDLTVMACSRVTRNLTPSEWKQYIGNALMYQAVCPNLPLEPAPTIAPTP